MSAYVRGGRDRRYPDLRWHTVAFPVDQYAEMLAGARAENISVGERVRRLVGMGLRLEQRMIEARRESVEKRLAAP